MSGSAGDRATGYFTIPWDGKVGKELNWRDDRWMRRDMSGSAGDRATGYFTLPWDGKVGMELNGRDDRMDEAGYVGQCRRPGHRLL